MTYKQCLTSILTSVLLLVVSGAAPCLAQQSAAETKDQVEAGASRAREVSRPAPDNPALSELRQAVEKAAGQPAKLRAARFAFAEALTKLGRDEEAAAEYDVIVTEAGGREPLALYNLGNCMARTGQNEKAGEAYRRAIEQRFGRYPRAQNNLGLVLLRLGKLDEAREVLQKAVSIEKGNFPDARFNLAQLYWQQGNMKLAEEEISAVLRMDPANEDARALAEKIRAGETATTGTGEIIVAAGAKDIAPGGIRTVTVKKNTFRKLQQARAARDKADLGMAVTLYQEAMKEEGSSVPAIQAELADVWMRLHKYTEAEEAWREVIAQAGERYPMAYYQAGRTMMRQDKYAAAVVLLRQAVTRAGDKIDIATALVESLEKMDDLDGAVQALEKHHQSHGESADSQHSQWCETKMRELKARKSAAARP
ncbi:MAG: tetratricopeptide repeat protein [Blastocatellia bacterium]